MNKTLAIPTPEPTPKELKKARLACLHCELYSLACSIHTARAMWRKYPELVEADSLIECLQKYLDEDAYPPLNEAALALLGEKKRQEEDELALKIAREWAAERVAKGGRK